MVNSVIAKFMIPKTRKRPESPMPTSRLGLGALTADDKIYVIGGKPKDCKVTGANEIFLPY